MTAIRRFDPAGLVAGILLLALAAIVFLDMGRLQIAPFYGIGPKAIPYAVAAGLALLGIGNLVLGFRGGFPARESLDLGRIFLILGALVALIGIIGFGFGFILASGVLFAAVARAFEERPIASIVRQGLAVAVILLALLVVLELFGLTLVLAGASLLATLRAILVAATLMLVAVALFSRHGALNLAVGFAISLVAYLLFAKLLALTLPAGPLERLF
jgi:putative tricarboxylic transport membrane protein